MKISPLSELSTEKPGSTHVHRYLYVLLVEKNHCENEKSGPPIVPTKAWIILPVQAELKSGKFYPSQENKTCGVLGDFKVDVAGVEALDHVSSSRASEKKMEHRQERKNRKYMCKR